ncbi:MAG: hypothetical protein M3290_04475 [Actinomycetota bacterium]|nr:hypothetical protein [Actinomycetota bacterium]
MKRGLAFLVYYLGLSLSIGTIFAIARHAAAWQFFVIPLYALPAWWIAAGIGIRLGVMPSEFFGTVARAAGLVEPPSEGSLREGKS